MLGVAALTYGLSKVLMGCDQTRSVKVAKQGSHPKFGEIYPRLFRVKVAKLKNDWLLRMTC